MIGRRDVLAGLAASGAGAAWPLRGQPVQEVEGPTVFDTGAEGWRMTRLRIPHPAGLADHLIGIAWPDTPAPPGGWPACHMLDGRAIEALLDLPLLEALAAQGGGAIVAHGYDRPDRFAGLERTVDYTPPGPEGEAVDDPRGRPGGGVRRYLERLAGQMLPAVEAEAPLDPSRRLLWGHSYAGLGVLQAALFSAAPFARLVAASPSLWWNDAEFFERVLAHLGAVPEGTALPALDLHWGSAERARASRPSNPDAQRLVRMRDALPEGAIDRLAAALKAAGAPGQRREFEGLSHGETFAASARATLLDTMPML